MNTRIIAALVLPLMFGAGTARWTSEDESKKIAYDTRRANEKFSELQAIKNSSRDADSILEKNKNILVIIQQTVADSESRNGKILRDVEGQTIVCEHDEKTRSEKEAALVNATAMAKQASVVVELARQTLEGAKLTVASKMTAKKYAEAALAKAQQHLVDVVSDENVGSSDVIAANRDKNDKAAELKLAEEELAHAKGNETAKATALTEAVAKSKSLAAAMQAAQKANATASAEVNSCKEALEKLRQQAAPILLGLRELNQSLGKQTEVVKSMTLNSTSLHKKLNATQTEYTELRQTLKEDSACKYDLQELEGDVRKAAASYNLTISAYQATPDDKSLFDAAWDTKDRLQNATYYNYLKQKDCAPKGTDIPPKSPMSTCGKDTGGTCRILWCDESRGARCDRDTHACVCTGATCASNGACHSRGNPAADLPTPAALGQATAQATTGAPLDAGSLGLLVVIAAVLVTAAFVHNKRRASRRVVLPTSLFG